MDECMSSPAARRTREGDESSMGQGRYEVITNWFMVRDMYTLPVLEIKIVIYKST